MPRSKTGFKRTPIRKENIERALQMIVDSELSIYRASKDFGIAETTLRRHRNEYLESGLDKYCFTKNNDVKLAFTEEEKFLVDYIWKAADLQYGLTLRDVRVLAYQFAKAKEI